MEGAIYNNVENVLTTNKRKSDQISNHKPTKKRRHHNSVKIQEFFPEEDINLGNRIAVLGKTGSGKSVVTWALCHALCPVIDLCVVMCPTAEENNYHKITPKNFIFEDFDEDYILSLISYQKRCMRKYGVDGTRKVLIILDDLAFDAKMFSCKAFKRLFFNGRWAQITVIITSQFALSMPPPIRSQLQLVLTACEFADNSLEKLHDNFFSIVKFTDFKRIMLEITQERTMLVVRQTYTDTNSVDNMFFWYKAPFPVAEFRMGDSKLWEMAERTYVDDEDEREMQEQKMKKIQAWIDEDKKPIYDIIKDTSRPRLPENTLSSRYQKRATIFNANPRDINPKAIDTLYKKPYQGPLYNKHTAKAYHSQDEIAQKRMRRRYGQS